MEQNQEKEEKSGGCCTGFGKGKKAKACSGTNCGGVYCLGFLGAAFYFIQHADTFGQGVLGLLKAIIWPAFLVYSLLGFLRL